MRAINHALTGALIGFIVAEPVIAVPAAVVSHFVCDSLPHYDYDQKDKSWIDTRFFRDTLIIDVVLCVALVTVLAVRRPQYWLLAAICAFLAAAPDLLWLKRFLYAKRGQAYALKGFDLFASRIQWFARPIGIVVEAVWFVGCIILLAQFLR